MTRYVRIGDARELGSRQSRRMVVENTDVALFYVDGHFYAVRNECPHQHFSALHEGILNGLELTCPMHGWTFDLTTGQATVGGGRLKRYGVKVVGNDVLLEAPDPEPDWAKK